MTETKEDIVKRILLTPIKCDKSFKEIKLIDGVICSTQKYYGEADCDISDFSIGFYEIIYKDIIPDRKLLTDSGKFINKEFAGDTINSFNSLANIILGDKNKSERSPKDVWPKFLIDYERDYHCLANFWMIPMRHGRTSPKLNYYDSLDCYLEQLREGFKSFKSDELISYPYDNNQYRNYFRIVESFDKFMEIHSITGYEIMDNPKAPYENRDVKQCENIIENIYSFMEDRANVISKKYTDKLYNYFLSLGLIEK